MFFPAKKFLRFTLRGNLLAACPCWHHPPSMVYGRVFSVGLHHPSNLLFDTCQIFVHMHDMHMLRYLPLIYIWGMCLTRVSMRQCHHPSLTLFIICCYVVRKPLAMKEPNQLKLFISRTEISCQRGFPKWPNDSAHYGMGWACFCTFWVHCDLDVTWRVWFDLWIIHVMSHS